MHHFSLQKNLGPYRVSRSVLQEINRYLCEKIPGILQLNLEKGRKDALNDSITFTTDYGYYQHSLRYIELYPTEQFADDVFGVTIELCHNNQFNYFGHKAIVLIMSFDLNTGYARLSIALKDDAPKEKMNLIAKDIRNLMAKYKAPATLVQLFQ